MHPGDDLVGESLEDLSISPSRVSDLACETSHSSDEDQYSLWMPLETEEPSEELVAQDLTFIRGSTEGSAHAPLTGILDICSLSVQGHKDAGSSQGTSLNVPGNKYFLEDMACPQVSVAKDFDIPPPQKEAVIEAMRKVSMEYVPAWAATLREEDWLRRLRNRLVERQQRSVEGREL